MSVEIKYLGRFGNHIFQYICGRVFARQNGLMLKTPLTDNRILFTTPHEVGADIKSPEIELRDGEELLSKKYGSAKYTLNGYFQENSWYWDREQEIRGMIFPSTQVEVNREDIVIHCRLTDFKSHNWAIHPSWYKSILKNEKFRQLYIVTDEFDERYLKHFNEYKPLILSSTFEEDWNFMRSFERIIISMSTYAWWAAFFGNAKKVYLFKRYTFGNGLNSFRDGVVVDGPLLHELDY